MAETSRTTKDPTKRSRKQIGLKSIFLTCKHYHHHHHHHHHAAAAAAAGEGARRKYKKIGCSGSICKLRDMQQRPVPAAPADQPYRRKSTSVANSCSPSQGSNNVVVTSNSMSSSNHSPLSAPASFPASPLGGSLRGVQLRKLSGCYECHNAVDPAAGASRDSPSAGAAISSCAQCGEAVKAESLERHQTVMHAVSELNSEDSSRSIVEIIFLSSWLKKQAPVCQIDRILKVHNNQKTITMFEDYREAVKSKASKLAKKHPRCTADGNELLRFYCTTAVCSLGLNRATSLCSSIPDCNLCSIIRDGFKADAQGRIRTTATSGRAHDVAQSDPVDDEKNAMLVCRVIAGRVRRNQDAAVEQYDSVAGMAGSSGLDELFVFNSRAILPCFVVIYRG